MCALLIAHFSLNQPCVSHMWPRKSDLNLKAELINWIQPLDGIGLGHAVKTSEVPRSKNQEISHKVSVFWIPSAKPTSGNRATF